MSTKTIKKSKKARQQLERAVVAITATYNNTHVVVRDDEGKVLTWATGGSAGFKGARESTPYAAQITAEKALEEAIRLHGIKEVSIYVKGIGPGRDQAIRGVVNSDVELMEIFDITPVPHNGCRKKKVRKL